MLGNKTRYFSLLILSLGLPSKVLCRSNERLNGLERTKSILRHDSKGATPRFSRLGYISPPSNVKEIQRGGDNDVPAGKLYSQLKIISYFALWYILNIQYNSKFSFESTKLVKNHVSSDPFTIKFGSCK